MFYHSNPAEDVYPCLPSQVVAFPTQTKSLSKKNDKKKNLLSAVLFLLFSTFQILLTVQKNTETRLQNGIFPRSFNPKP
jgi:hypothetical protein